MGLALGILIVFTIPLPRRWRPVVLGTVVIAGLAFTGLKWQGIAGLKREAGSVAAQASVDQRVCFAYVSWQMFLDRPLWGHGLGQFADAVKPYLSDRSTPLALETIRGQPHHSTFLGLLTETGIVGMGLFLAVLAGWAHGAWQLWRNAAAPDWARAHGLVMLGILGIYVGPALFVDLSYSPHAHRLIFLLAGVTQGLLPMAGGATAWKQNGQPIRWTQATRPPLSFDSA
ncbi:MAG: O-antigen ligase family protein, partial [Planctomycetota bacterium]|jgi:O-antigen ligase